MLRTVRGDNEKIGISTPKLSFINNIGTPPNYPSKHMLEIAESGANIHLVKQATKTRTPVIMRNYTTARPQDGITMESSHIVTLKLPGLRKQARHIHISPKC